MVRIFSRVVVCKLGEGGKLAYLLLSPVAALWGSTTLLTRMEEGVAAALPDTLLETPPDAASPPPAVVADLPAPPLSGSLGVEVKAQLTRVRPDLRRLPPLAWGQAKEPGVVQR